MERGAVVPAEGPGAAGAADPRIEVNNPASKEPGMGIQKDTRGHSQPTGTDETNEARPSREQRLGDLPQVRTEKVERARRAIRDHRYDDDAVVEVTLDRLFDQMGAG